MKTGIAIIGQGYMGRTHAAAWKSAGRGDDIKYVCTPRPRGPMESAPHARLVTDLRDVLDDPEVGIVSVCTPTPTHREITQRLLEAGKHVLLEKPIALTIDDALAIRESAINATGILMVAQVVRFFEGHRVMREDVAAGRIGQVLSARARRLIPRPDGGQWWHDDTQSGGAIVDLAIHDFDQMNLFLGRPVAVTSTSAGKYGPIETTIEYGDGGLGQVLTHADLAPGVPFTAGISLVGDAGLADYELSAASPTDQGGDEDRHQGVDGYRLAAAEGGYTLAITGDDPYVRQARYFLDCVESGLQPKLSDAGSAVRALEVALAARDSLRMGRRAMVHSRISDSEATGAALVNHRPA